MLTCIWNIFNYHIACQCEINSLLVDRGKMLKLNVNVLIYWGIYFTDLATCQKIMSTCSLHFYPNWVPSKEVSGKSLFLALVNCVSHFFRSSFPFFFTCYWSLFNNHIDILGLSDQYFYFAASLAPSVSDDLLAKATSEVVQLLKNKSAKSDITRTNIQMIGSLR